MFCWRGPNPTGFGNRLLTFCFALSAKPSFGCLGFFFLIGVAKEDVLVLVGAVPDLSSENQESMSRGAAWFDLRVSFDVFKYC